MKVKTSVTRSEDVPKQLDDVLGRGGNRSEFIEESLRLRLRDLRRAKRNARDAAICARMAADPEVPREHEEMLEFQEDLWNEETCTESLSPLETREATESSSSSAAGA